MANLKLKKNKKSTAKKVVVKRGKLKKNTSPFKRIFFEKNKTFRLKVKSLAKRVYKKRKANTKIKGDVKLQKALNNPIISPSIYPWESKATFNPAAFEHNGKIHLIYRAIGENNLSSLGYASSFDGLNIEDRPTYFCYKRNFKPNKDEPKVEYLSGGSFEGGCEDPRLTLIGNRVYMIFTAFDGWNSIRLAMTSISISDFKKKKWNWKKAVFISPCNGIYKNWVLFPEKIKGKYAILHSLSPKILIYYTKDLDDFDGKTFIESIHQDHPDWNLREKGIRGTGPTPIKTKDGWLILYHKTEENDPNKYKIFAMILDYKDPTRILYRSSRPILEPEESYEQESYRGIVYSCGAVVKDKQLFVYYGAGDKHCCVATINLQELLEDLKANKEIKLNKLPKKK